jgi:hypothetical protein
VTEWWTYRLDSFLLFSARTYQRLIELYNTELWPLQWVALGVGAWLWLWLAREHSTLRDRAVFLLLAAVWWWVAWGFLHQRFAPINFTADYAAWLFAAQGAAMLWVGVIRGGVVFRRERSPTDPIALGLIALGLVLYPLLGWLSNRTWSQAAVFGLMPEPTAIVTLGFLLLADPMPRGLFVVPVLSCAFSGAMLLALRSGDAWLSPAAALIALACLLWRRKRLLHHL